MATKDDAKRISARLVAKVWSDPDFKARLMAQPVAVLREYGVDVPEGVTVAVHEDTPSSRHIVLPPRPPQLPQGQVDPKKVVVPMNTVFHNLIPPKNRPKKPGGGQKGGRIPGQRSGRKRSGRKRSG